VRAIRCEQVGVASMLLGGGREKKEDAIDPAVGLEVRKKIGDAVKAGETICTVHYNCETRVEEAKALLEGSFEIGEAAPRARPLVRKIIGGEGLR
jgi:pyrimidine-nucleoside phosphorylase